MLNPDYLPVTAPSVPSRKGTWEVTAVTLGGKRYHYSVDTERDADLFVIALTAHCPDLLDVVVAAHQ